MDKYEAYARNVAYTLNEYNERVDIMLTQMLQATGMMPPQLVNELKEYTKECYEQMLASHIQTLRDHYTEEQIDFLNSLSADHPWIAEKKKIVAQFDFAAGQELGNGFGAIAQKFIEENPNLMEQWLLEQDFSEG